MLFSVVNLISNGFQYHDFNIFCLPETSSARYLALVLPLSLGGDFAATPELYSRILLKILWVTSAQSNRGKRIDNQTAMECHSINNVASGSVSASRHHILVVALTNNRIYRF
jgi:hypothetical protein